MAKPFKRAVLWRFGAKLRPPKIPVVSVIGMLQQLRSGQGFALWLLALPHITM
jgi:hypothetical protein